MALDSITIKLGELNFHVSTKPKGKHSIYDVEVIFERSKREHPVSFNVRYDINQGIFLDNTFAPCRERFFTARKVDILKCEANLNKIYRALIRNKIVNFPDYK